MGAYSDRVIADGATHYWRLGEPSGTTAADSIVAGNAPGTISGGVTLNQAGPLADGSKAMGFPGGTTANITTAGITIPIVTTIEFWLKTTVASAGPAAFSTRGLSTGAIIIIWIDGPSGALSIYTTATIGSTKVVNDGQWHHVAFALDGSQGLYYVDGVFQPTAFGFVRGAASVGPAAIGWDQGNPQSWNGALAEVAIYPTALSAPTLAAHYALRTATGGGGGTRSPIPWGAFAQQGSPT